jgi:hypothetical protein
MKTVVKKYVTVKETADIMGVTPQMVYYLIGTGRMKTRMFKPDGKKSRQTHIDMVSVRNSIGNRSVTKFSMQVVRKIKARR